MIKKRKIVAIGGGKLKDPKHIKIHQEIIKISGKKNPQVLFIPTAGYDSKDYNDIIEKVYGKKLNCKIEYLYLLAQKPTKKYIQDKIFTADIVYVPGGNTLKMMKVWRTMGVDKLLKKAWEKGTVLTGISAGSICWFNSGHSDSMSFYSPKNWHYIKVKGLGFIKGIHCPHYDSETRGKKRKNDFKRMMMKTGNMGIAIDDDCAIAFINNEFRVMAVKKNAKAYKVFKKNKKIIEEIIPRTEKFTPIAKLYER